MDAEQVSITRDEGGNWWVLWEGQPGLLVDRRVEESRMTSLIEMAESWERFVSLITLEVFGLTYTGKPGVRLEGK